MVDDKSLEVNIQPFWRLRANSIPGVGGGALPLVDSTGRLRLKRVGFFKLKVY